MADAEGHSSCACLHSSAALFAWFYMLECKQTQEVLCCQPKGKRLIRKSPQVNLHCLLDCRWNLLLLILLVWSVGFVVVWGFLVVCFWGGCLAISGKYLVNTCWCYNLKMLLRSGEFLCYEIKLVSGTALASRLQSF